MPNKIKRLSPARTFRIYFMGSYVPRQCGIATFTHDLACAVDNELGMGSCHIAAINNRSEGYDYPEEVGFEIHQNRLNDYRLAADYVNFSGIDMVCVQHEFGIYGGPEGSYIKNFLGYLKKPVVTTFHTVLKEPGDAHRNTLKAVADLSEAVVVMSVQAKSLLTQIYDVPESKIFFIPHGIPDVPFIDPNYLKDQFQVEGKLVLLTFGLLSPNKGIETVIKALPEIISKFPNTAYIVLGATHPEIKRTSGEEYRISLQRRIMRLGLEKHVFFHNRFVDLDELCDFISACDIYITPYLGRDQITSGSLAYALGMGKAVISTPYTYAEEMLMDGRGILFPFGDFRTLAQRAIELMGNEVKRHQMRKKGYELGRDMIWSKVARQYLDLFRSVANSYQARKAEKITPAPLPQDLLPEINFDHIRKLTDETGIIQHSLYGVSDRRFGYSTDDVSRALVVSLMAYAQLGDDSFLDLSGAYLAFLKHAQLENGRFHNFMSYSRQFIDEEGSEDTLGRAIWGLGYTVYAAPVEGWRNIARELFERAVGDIKMNYPMSRAYAILGLYHFLQRFGGATHARKLLQVLADELLESYVERRDGWSWFLPGVTYGNAKISQALLLAYKVLGNEQYKKIALESLDFLTAATFTGEFFNFAGNDCWLDDGKGRTFPIEQPIDTGYTVEAYVLAHEVTGESRYYELARIAFDWFLGRNRLGACLYNFSTGACYDGLECNAVNLNQGAESTICFLLASLTISDQQILREVKSGYASKLQADAHQEQLSLQ